MLRNIHWSACGKSVVFLSTPCFIYLLTQASSSRRSCVSRRASLCWSMFLTLSRRTLCSRYSSTSRWLLCRIGWMVTSTVRHTHTMQTVNWGIRWHICWKCNPYSLYSVEHKWERYVFVSRSLSLKPALPNELLCFYGFKSLSVVRREIIFHWFQLKYVSHKKTQFWSSVLKQRVLDCFFQKFKHLDG